MPLTSDGIGLPSQGLVKIPGGDLKWQCTRDFSSSIEAASQLQKFTILTEFLQKQDEAMSLFIEGLFSTVQEYNSFDAPGTDHGNITSCGEHEETTNGGALAQGPQDASHSPRPSSQKDVGSVRSASKTDGHLAIADEKANLDLKNKGIHFSDAQRQMAVGPTIRILHGVETWSNWWVNLQEPPRTSRFAKVVNSGASHAVTVAIIVLDTLCIAVSADFEMESVTPPGFLNLVEWFFVSFYIIEIILKLAVHGLFFFVNDDMCWNMLDIALVASSSMTLLNSTMKSRSMGFLRTFRIARALKSFRIFKVISFFRDLRVMLECIYGSFLALFWCLTLLFMIMLIFAIFYVQSLASYLEEEEVSSIEKDAIQHRFGSVRAAVLTLYEIATGMIEVEDIYLILEPTGYFNSGVLLLLIGFFQISLINILTGLFVEKAMQCAKPERDIQVMEQRQETMSRVIALRDLCHEFHLSESGIIKRDEFIKGLHEPNTKFAFENEGLQIRDAEAFFDLLQWANGKDSVDIDTFVASCMRLRGNATSIDLLDFEFKMNKSIEDLRTQMGSVEAEEESILKDRRNDIVARGDNTIQVLPTEPKLDAGPMLVPSDGSQTFEQQVCSTKPERCYRL